MSPGRASGALRTGILLADGDSGFTALGIGAAHSREAIGPGWPEAFSTI